MKKILQQYNRLSPKIRATLWFAVCLFMQKGVSIISTPIFTRLLTTAEYGEFNVFNSWMDIVTIFVSLKLCAGVYTQGLVKFSERQNEFASSMQGLSFVLTLTWTLIYFVFHEFWNALFSLTTPQMLCMLVMIWATAAFNFWATTQRVNPRYRALVAVTVITSVLKPALGVLLVLHAQDKVTARIFGLTLVELICYSCLFFVQLRTGKKFFSKEFWKYALAFNLPLIPHYLSTAILSSVDRLMIKNMMGAAEAGIYSIGYQIAQSMTLVSVALEQSVQPWLYEKIKHRSVADVGRVIYPAFILLTGCISITMLVAPELIMLFAPPSYHDAIWVLPPVMISVCLVFAYTMFGSFEFYFEKTKYISLATVTGAVMNIVLNWIFIRAFGYIAAGYTTLVCYLFFVCFHYVFMRKICKEELDRQYPYDVRVLLVMLGLLFCIGTFSLVTYNHPLLRYMAISVFILICIWKKRQIIATLKMVMNMRSNKWKEGK